MISALLDYTQPLLYGLLAWLDAISGWRPGRDPACTEPEVVA